MLLWLSIWLGGLDGYVIVVVSQLFVIELHCCVDLHWVVIPPGHYYVELKLLFGISRGRQDGRGDANIVYPRFRPRRVSPSFGGGGGGSEGESRKERDFDIGTELSK